MTDQHPLTDDIIIAKKLGCIDEYGDWYYNENDLRAAADWQLEQVLEWGYKYLYPDQVNPLRKAMRPQQ